LTATTGLEDNCGFLLCWLPSLSQVTEKINLLPITIKHLSYLHRSLESGALNTHIGLF
jgi:hypothetical protein